jgi:predicted RecB family endonuclease
MSETRVFVSYTRTDRVCDKLAEHLRQEGVAVSFDEWEISVGDSIIQKIDDALDRATAFVIVLSNAAVNSRWQLEGELAALLSEFENLQRQLQQDAPSDQVAELEMRIGELLETAATQRCLLEARMSNASKATPQTEPVRSSASLLYRIDFLGAHGVNVRSKAWSRLVAQRNEDSHGTSVAQLVGASGLSPSETAELHAVMSRLCRRDA